MFELIGGAFVQMADCCVVADSKCCFAYTSSKDETIKKDGADGPDGPVTKRQKLDRNSVEDLLIIQKKQIDYRFTILKREGDLFYVSF